MRLKHSVTTNVIAYFHFHITATGFGLKLAISVKGGSEKQLQQHTQRFEKTAAEYSVEISSEKS